MVKKLSKNCQQNHLVVLKKKSSKVVKKWKKIIIQKSLQWHWGSLYLEKDKKNHQKIIKEPCKKLFQLCQKKALQWHWGSLVLKRYKKRHQIVIKNYQKKSQFLNLPKKIIALTLRFIGSRKWQPKIVQILHQRISLKNHSNFETDLFELIPNYN